MPLDKIRKKCIDWQVSIAERWDRRQDMKVCGTSLVEFLPSIYLETHGALQSQPSHYWMLDKCLGHLKFAPDEHILDLGCGKGRILAWLLRQGVKCPLTGVELDPRVSEVAKAWTARYPQVNILQNSVLYIDLSPYSTIIMYNPFLDDVLAEFVDKLEREARPGTRLVYLSDQFFGDYLNDRPGWRLIERRAVRWCHGMRLSARPQRYSIWERLKIL